MKPDDQVRPEDFPPLVTPRFHRVPPSVIELMLRCYYEPDAGITANDAGQSAFEFLLREGLLMRKRMDSMVERVVPSPKGEAWVEMICRTPFPVREEIWKDPRL